MPLLTPLYPIIIVLLFAMTGISSVMWVVKSKDATSYKSQLETCKAKHQAFVDQVETAGRRAAEKARQIETEQQRIADETAKSWAAALDFVRADAARRMRAIAGQGGAGGSGLSEAAKTGLTIADADPDPIPSSERVAADCAETTITANSLQGYIERIQGQQE